MRTGSGDELRVLRERAYGPDADIHRDAAALERLQQLESIGVADPATLDDPPADAASPVRPAAPTPPPGDAAAPPRPRRRLRTRLLWSGSLLVAVLAGFGLARLLDGPRPNALLPEARQVAVLSLDASVPVPGVLASEGQDPPVTMRSDFLGLRTVVGDAGWGGPTTDGRCLWIVPAADAFTVGGDSYSGQTFYGCGAGGFPAAVAFTVDDELPAELQQAYPVGTALQFVLDPDSGDVVVYTDR